MLESRPVPKNLILLNGRLVTLDPAIPRATALVLRGDEIEFVGDDATAAAMRGHGGEILDLHGQLVLPAFTDSHIHFTGFATSLTNVDLAGCRSLEEALDRVAARAVNTPRGTPIRGGGWNNADWADASFPTRQSLDRVAPVHPVFLTRKDGHSIWVNSLALAQANITRSTTAPEGGLVDRDASGDPTGILREKALELLGGGIGAFDAALPQAALLDAIRQAHAAGLVTIHNLEGAASLRAFQALHAEDALTLRVVHSLPADSLEHAVALGLSRGLGDEWLRVQAVKIFADGSLGSHTAEMRAPFLDTPGQCGVAVTDTSTLAELARAAVGTGLDVWTHAIGDAAITRVLDVYSRLRREGARPLFRIEHVQHLHPTDVARFRESNVVASMQPIHQPGDMRAADALLGPERTAWTYAFRALLDAGATLAFGSDCPVERFEPLLGIHAAVTRQNAAGMPPGGWVPAQRITVAEAVRAYTLGAAESVGDAARAGSLTRGKRADVVVLAQDIFEIAPQQIPHVGVTLTVSGGKIVHTA